MGGRPVGDTAGGATEIDDLAAGENINTHTDSGTLAFTDVDLTDSHTVFAAADDEGYRGTLTAAIADPSTGDGAGSIGWTFTVADSALDDLAAGQTLTQTYTVVVEDGQGGGDSETVTITLTGTNDEPVIGVGDTAGGATEIDDLAAGENTATHTDTGAIAFADVDLSDDHTVSVTPQGGGYRGGAHGGDRRSLDGRRRGLDRLDV
jgi:VCBS repeat-containing protein